MNSGSQKTSLKGTDCIAQGRSVRRAHPGLRTTQVINPERVAPAELLVTSGTLTGFVLNFWTSTHGIVVPLLCNCTQLQSSVFPAVRALLIRRVQRKSSGTQTEIFAVTQRLDQSRCKRHSETTIVRYTSETESVLGRSAQLFSQRISFLASDFQIEHQILDVQSQL